MLRVIRSKSRCLASVRHLVFIPRSLANWKKAAEFATIAEPPRAGGPKVTTEIENSGSRSWRENPNLKYWVIGVSLIGGVIFHYVYRDRESKRLIVKNLPAPPNHPVNPREDEVSELKCLHQSLTLKGGNGVAMIRIVGQQGTGKTQLASLLAEEMAKEEQAKFRILPKNHFTGYVNASSLDTLILDVKRFSIALGCQEDDWKSKVKKGSDFLSLSKEEQLQCFIEALKEKLKDNSGWILVIDNLCEEAFLDKWFSDDTGGNWGNGAVIVTSRNVSKRYLKQDTIYSLDKGMSTSDAVDLLQKVSGIPDEESSQADEIAVKLGNMPLAIAAAGYYLQLMSKEVADYSHANFLSELDEAFKMFHSSFKGEQSATIKQLIPAYVTIALATRKAVSSDSHLLHAFDLIGSCSPNWPVPTSLISIYLTVPEFRLSPLKGKVLDALTSKGTGDSDADAGKISPDEEVQEAVLSIKRMAKALESFTTAVKENYNAIKTIFYPPEMEMPTMTTGASELLKGCPLVSLTKISPGDVEAVVVHPLVHSVFCQTFTSVTAPQLEDKFLEQAQSQHDNSSWFRRLQAFNPQRSLQEHRNSLGENPSTNNAPSVNVSGSETPVSTLKEADLQQLLKTDHRKLEEFRQIRPLDMTRHCQEHKARVLRTIKKEAAICGQDSKTRTVAKLLMPHLDHILATNTVGSLGPKSRAQALLASSSMNSTMGNLTVSRGLLEEALEIEKQQFGELSTEAAETLTCLGNVHNSLGNSQKGRDLLEESLRVYETLRKNHGEYKNKLGLARTLISLGILYGGLGFKDTSKDYLERGFSYMQAGAPPNPDELEGRRFAQDISTTLTDVGHAYLSVGQILQGKKLLDLALMGHKNLHGDDHPEVARTLTVLSIACSMQGNSQESRKMRNEAGKIQAKLGASPML